MSDLGDLEVLGAQRLLDAGRVELVRRVTESRGAQADQHAAQVELAHLLIHFIHRGGGGAGGGCGLVFSSPHQLRQLRASVVARPAHRRRPEPRRRRCQHRRRRGCITAVQAVALYR